MAYVCKFKKLKDLRLSGTRIKLAGIKQLASLKHLEYLDISECNFVDDQCLEALQDIKSLKRLRINGIHRLTDDGIKQLSKIRSLSELNVGGNKNITMEGLGEFGASCPLKELSIDGLPKLSAIGLRNCQRFENLKELSITQKRISIEHLNALTNIPNLESLSLSGTYDRDFYQHVRDSLPSLAVDN
jgi:Leucine-rich repeat (LRR) protein